MGIIYQTLKKTKKFLHKPKDVVRNMISHPLRCAALTAAYREQWQPFFVQLAEHYQIDRLAKDVVEYIQASIWVSSYCGPAHIGGCLDYLGTGYRLKGAFMENFPAFCIDSDTWLMLTNAKVITLNHDCELKEAIQQAERETDNRHDFLERLADLGSLFNLSEFLEINCRLAKLDDRTTWYSDDVEQNKAVLRAIQSVKHLDDNDLESLVFSGGAASFIYEAAMPFLEQVEAEDATIAEIHSF